MVFHIGALRLDTDSQHKTAWHLLTPSARLLCVLLLVFAIALTPNGHWATWLIYGAGVSAIALISQVTLLDLVRRVAVEFVFVGVVLLGTLFRSGGQVVWQWGWLQITTAGLIVLGSVTIKMLLSLTLLNILTLTTPIPDLLTALVVLRVPPLLVAIIGSMYRYIGVLGEEFSCMKRAALSRNLMANKRWQRLVIGNMIGSLFIRTYERGERVHQAMLARGYSGVPPLVEAPQGTWRDRWMLVLTIFLMILGQFPPHFWGLR
jgi:cobalt/nickel transport system permease protein